MTDKATLRVVVNINDSGEFTVYSDPGVEVICRFVSAPDDELYRVDPERIPAGWLDKLIGYAGDGSEAEARAQIVADALAGISGQKNRLN